MSAIPAASIFAGVATIAVLMTAMGGWYTVDQGERTVVTRFGAVKTVSEPGLHLKAPWIDDTHDISVRVLAAEWHGSTALDSYSKDQQTAKISVKVTFHVLPTPATVTDIYTRYKSTDGFASAVIVPRVQEAIKTVFGQFNAIRVVQNRAEFNKEAELAVKASVVGEPVAIDGVQMFNIDFSDAYERAIEDRMKAEVEVARVTQNLDRERKEAEIKVVQATAEATSTKLRGEAEAAAIKARSDALKDSPKLVELTAAERWDGHLPTTMIPGGTVPFLPVGK